jgi:hypothetical protein
MEDADFSGYATKTGLKCSDGRTIMKDAFAHQDKMTVPLVWQHGHTDPENVLGHAVLENREDGVYCWGYFNDTVKGQSTKKLVQHGDVTFLSIYANNLVEKAKQVFHGAIREVSLVLAGANPGAKIDFVALQHADGSETELEDEAVIYTGLVLQHADTSASVEHAEGDDETLQDIYDSFSEKQKEVVHIMIGAALEASDEESAAHSADDDSDDSVTDTEDESEQDSDDAEETDESDDSDDGDTSNSDTNDEGDLNHQEGTSDMTRNVFDRTDDSVETGPKLTHSQIATIVESGRKLGSLKEGVLAHADEYGITDINMLFPDAKALSNSPEFISRRMEWVSKVLGGTRHSPFAKVKTVNADITEPEARAKGYMKGNLKKEEVFKLLKRTTGPATIYKKQKLDRDDILDITDFDVVNWLKAEMRLMIEEEIARAVLVGDGRSAADEDKVKDPEGAVDGTGIRSILNDSDLYSIKKTLPSNVQAKDVVKSVVRATDEYRGTGSPTMFIGRSNLTELLLDEDRFGRPLYADKRALADKLGVQDIVPVDIFNEYEGLYAIIVNLVDYTIGSNRGGELTNFEDFDIDYNQHKYLQETRLSGGLTKPHSAIVVRRELGTEATPVGPSWDGATDTITIPATTGVEYYNAETDAEMTGDVVITESTEVRARAEEGYYIPAGTTTSWTFTP